MLKSNTLRTLLDNPLVLPLYLPSLVFAFCLGMLVPILPLYAVNFGVSYGLVGLVLAGEGIGRLFSDLPAGMLLRRFGKKGSMMLGVGCIALSTVALFWAQSIPEAFIYRLLSGFGAALFNVSRHAYIADAIVVGSRGRAIALYGGINRIGKFAGPAVGGVVAAAYGLEAPFLLFGIACTIVLITIGLFVRRTGTMPYVDRPLTKPHHNHLFAMLKTHRRVLTNAGAGQLFAQMIRAGREVIIPLYAADIIGLDVQDIGLIISTAAAVDMTLFYPAGYVMDRWGRKFAIVPSFSIQAIGMALVPFSGSFTGLLVVTSLIGFGNGLGSGTMMTLGADLAPKAVQGEFLGLWRFIGDIGATGAPLVVGGIADLVVLQMAALALSGSGWLAALTFIFLVPETLKRSQRTPKTS